MVDNYSLVWYVWSKHRTDLLVQGVNRGVECWLSFKTHNKQAVSVGFSSRESPEYHAQFHDHNVQISNCTRKSQETTKKIGS